MDAYVEGKTYSKTDVPPAGTYENCIFEQCHWQEGNVAKYVFTSCEFRQCDLTMLQVPGTTFNGVVFDSCRLTGIHFEQADPHLFDVIFRECVMTLCSFYGMKLPEQFFGKCQLHEADFTNALLRDANFEDSDLSGVIFRACNLEGADFRRALNVVLQLSENKVEGAQFCKEQLPGLLTTFKIIISN